MLYSINMNIKITSVVTKLQNTSKTDITDPTTHPGNDDSDVDLTEKCSKFALQTPNYSYKYTRSALATSYVCLSPTGSGLWTEAWIGRGKELLPLDS